MHALWFWLVSVMVAIYVVLDGFDFGVGILHCVVARKDSERREVLSSIGPYWGANEVWLLAAGGSLFMAFPRVLAAGFSGFYLAMFLVLWTLILRGVSMEFRSHVLEPMWRAAFDFVFVVASTLLPVLLGAALGNVLRGVPLDASGTFGLPLFTDFSAHDPVGILDWYTVTTGVFALVVIAAHGAVFLAWKTAGDVHARCMRLAPRLWATVTVLWILVTWATHAVNPGLFTALPGRPLAWLGSGVVVGGFACVWVGLRSARPRLAFLGSSAFILGLLATTAACVYPVMLRSLGDPALSLTAENAGSSVESLKAGLGWWFLGFPFALFYLVFLLRLHRGKVAAAREGEGY
jgi:cytochrome d ubiquinol oxidase subunit II